MPKQINLKIYVQKVMKQVHPDQGMTAQSSIQLNAFLLHVTELLNQRAQEIVLKNDRKKVTSRDVQSAVHMLIPGELAKHSVSEGYKAITKFNSSEHGTKENPRSTASRAGLQFSPPAIEKIMRFNTDTQLNDGAIVYLTSVIEYICAEILELSGNVARDNRKTLVTPRFMCIAIENDEELKSLFDSMGMRIIAGGVIPNIHSRFLPTKEHKAQLARARSKSDKGDRKGSHRFLPGTVSLRDIRSIQKGSDLLCQKAPFAHSVRETAKDYIEHVRFGPDALINMQFLVESLTIDIIRDAVEICVYSDRETVKGGDIALICKLKGISTENTIQMTNPGMERLGRRAGVKFFDHASQTNYYDMVKAVMGYYVNMLVKDSITLVDSYRMKTINMKVFSDACAMNNIVMPYNLHFNTVKRKGSRKGSKSAESEDDEIEEEIEEETIEEDVEVGDATSDED
jgi:histone H2A